MSIQEIIFGGGGLLLVVLTMVQIAPIKINPWSALGKALGKVINGDVLEKLDEVQKAQKDTRKALDEHIKVDDERNADMHRMRILQFNLELLENKPHTREDFIEIFAEIDFYERYCKEHEEYKNNRCNHAIMNIGRVYDDRLRKRDFADVDGAKKETN